MKKVEVLKSSFLTFLIKAKINTWAGDGKKIRKKDNSRNYYYSEGDFEYRDQYFGNLMDGGREIVFFKNIPIWIMCYHGGVLSKYNNKSRDIFAFLRKALSCPPSEFPVRGPALFLNRDFKYENLHDGNLYYFYGHEKILFKNVEVYRRGYVGGEIRDRDYYLGFSGEKEE